MPAVGSSFECPLRSLGRFGAFGRRRRAARFSFGEAVDDFPWADQIEFFSRQFFQDSNYRVRTRAIRWRSASLSRCMR